MTGFVFVDDDRLTVDMVSWIIRKSAHEAKLFTSASEALDYLMGSTPRLLVVDYYMPDMTGLEFISRLHDSDRLDGTQVYLCSAVRPPEAIREQFAALHATILEKQVVCDKRLLTEFLDRHLDA